MTTILVALDGSDKDRRAIPAAAALADLVDGEIHLIRVVNAPVESFTDRAHMMGVVDALLESRAEAQRRTQDIAGELAAETGRPVTVEIAEGPDAASVVLDRADAHGIALVVMATRAPGALDRAIRGSVADEVMRRSPRPVVLVPPGTDDAGGLPLRLRRVLIPLDGSAPALGAADSLLELSRGRELEYIVTEVVTSGFVLPTTASLVPGWPGDSALLEAYHGLPDIATARAGAEQRLQAAAHHLRARGATRVRSLVLDDGDPAAAIRRVAHDEDVDLITMSTRGAGGLERFVLGSVAERVVRDSTVPVFLVTPRVSAGAA